MKQTKKLSRKVISVVLSLLMVLSTMTGLMPGMSLTAQAADPYASLKNSTTVIKFGNNDWYLIDYDENTVTLFLNTVAAESVYGSNTTYSGSTIEGVVNAWYEQNIPIDDREAVSGGMFLLTKGQADAIKAINAEVIKCSYQSPQGNGYWFYWLDQAAAVNYHNGDIFDSGRVGPNEDALGVRPALKLDLSKVTFDSNNNTFSVGSPKTNQTVTAPTAATNLTYTGQELALLTGGASVSEGNGNTGATIQYSLTPTDDNSWVDSYTAVKATNAGEYKVYYRVAGNDTYADFVSSNEQAVPVKIEKADSVTLEDAQKPVAKTGDDVVYTGEPIELVTAPTTDLPLDYEAYYSTDDGVTWSKDIPEKEDPGKYTIKVKYVSAGKNCEDIILEDITVTITPADKTALTDVIAAAKEYYDTIKDDYKEVAEKLDKAIKAAEEVAEKNNVTKADVSAAAEAVTKAKNTAEAEVKDIDDTKAAQAVIDKINELKPVENIKPEDRTKIKAAREAYKKLSDDQKTKLTGLDSTAVSTLEAAEKALIEAEKAAFDDEKEVQKKAADALAAEGDSDASKKLIEDAKKAIDALAYDETKSLDENKKAVAAILNKLKDDLTTQRAADKKEADDTAAAKKVTDAINALPASDKVATTDKAAIEAARKAYDNLTADQKKKVPADVLKKLTDAEKALKAAKELEAAKKEAQAAMNEQVTVTQKGNKFTVKWKKAKSADGYYVYAQYCGKKFKKPVKTIKKNTTTKVTIKKINGKKLNLKKQFRVYVVPYKIIDGKKVKLGKSMVGHVVGSKNTKYSNVKKLTLKKKKYTVKVGKTAKIKAKITLVNKNKKHIPKGHGAKFRYKSSDTSIATVSKNGKIKGIKKGKCTIYVYSINGLTKKAKITVK